MAANVLQFPAQSGALAPVLAPAGTIALAGPSTVPGAPLITPDAINMAVNTALATKVEAASGTTAARPTGLGVGTPYFDTTIGVPIWWNGTIWVNSAGGAI